MPLIKDALKVIGLPDNQCFNSMQDFLNRLPSLLTVEIPDTITNVVISNVQPDNPYAVWFAMSNTNVFLGVRLYSAGVWIQVFPVPQGVFWVYGDSRIIPDGYALITTGIGQIPSSDVTHIMAQYRKGDPAGTYFTYFALIYTGVPNG